MREAPPDTLPAIFLRFLRFGVMAWGGPVAQVAMLKRDLVDREAWLAPSRFTRLLAIYQLLPGPEAHELAVHLGMIRRGRLGGLLAGLGFMLPGLLLMLALSWAYARIDMDRAPLAGLLLGVQVGVIALIVRAVHRIGQHILTGLWLGAVAAFAFAASLAGAPWWIVLAAGAIAYPLARHHRFVLAVAVVAMAILLAWLTSDTDSARAAATAAVAAGSVAALPLFVSGLKAGLLTFGGAYTAIPFIRDDAVGRGWIDDGQFLDGLALAGIIPAPLVIFATFVGFQAGGLGGALAMTAGMFLPAFAMTLLFFDRLERVVADERLRHPLEGVAAAVVGMIAATALDLGLGVARSVPALLPAALVFAAGLALLYGWRSTLAVPAVIGLSAMAGALAFA